MNRFFKIVTIALLLGAGSIDMVPAVGSFFPDYTALSSEELNRKTKSGLAEVVLGLGLEQLANHIPHSGTPYSRSTTEVFDPKIVRTLGNGMIIDGSKDLFFSLQERYNRYRASLDTLSQGSIDIAIAFFAYNAPQYIPHLLQEPFLELGGQAGCMILYTILALRGTKLTVEGLKQYFISYDLERASQTCLTKVYAWGAWGMNLLRTRQTAE